MATFNSVGVDRAITYRVVEQEDELTVEFYVNIGSGVTLTDGDFINLFYLGSGHEIHEMYFRSTDELDTGSAALTASCGWGSGSTEVFANTSTQFKTDPVNFSATRVVPDTGDIAIAAATATTGASDRLVRLEVNTTANAATDTDASLYGYAKVRRTAVTPPSYTYGWDGHSTDY